MVDGVKSYGIQTPWHATRASKLLHTHKIHTSVCTFVEVMRILRVYMCTCFVCMQKVSIQIHADF